jgi:catechol 2,3-dioxygenase-like lactoylglutathione lyase family enzyme
VQLGEAFLVGPTGLLSHSRCAMKVLGIRWVGVHADSYDEMVGFLRDVLGLQVAFEDDASAEFSLANDDRVQVFGPGHRYHELFGAGGGGPVPLFEVDDLQAARAELVAAGIEVIGEIEQDASWQWLNFRGPDGNLFELASRT